MSYEKFNKAMEEKYGKVEDMSFEQLVAIQKAAKESGLTDQIRATMIAEARNLPDNNNIPAGTDPVIAALAKTNADVAQKILKLQETQRQLAESMARLDGTPGPQPK